MFILVQIRAIVVGLALAFYLMLICILAVPARGVRKRLNFVRKHWQRAGILSLKHAAQAKLLISEDRRSERARQDLDTGLFISNHQSFVDIPVIVTKLQAPPIMKKEVLYIPFIGFLGWICGAIPVSRSSMGSKRKVLDLTRRRILQENVGVQVYPEGTRSKTGTPAPYEKIARALLVLAYKDKIPVTPISIYGTRGVFNSFGLVNPHKQLGIIVHHELLPQDYASADEFGRACWSRVIEGHQELTTRIAQQSRS